MLDKVEEENRVNQKKTDELEDRLNNKEREYLSKRLTNEVYEDQLKKNASRSRRESRWLRQSSLHRTFSTGNPSIQQRFAEAEKSNRSDSNANGILQVEKTRVGRNASRMQETRVRSSTRPGRKVAQRKRISTRDERPRRSSHDQQMPIGERFAGEDFLFTLGSSEKFSRTRAR